MPPLPEPSARPPILFGETAASALLPWGWAARRLADARNYWVAAVRLDGRPICRPLWAIWQEDGLWLTTGSHMVRSLPTNPAVSVNLEDGTEVLILEGIAEAIHDADALAHFVAVYNAKYDHTAFVENGEISNDEGPIGPAYRITPTIVFGWQADMRDPTRWTFPRV
jgi:hypothetical protein